MATINTHHKRTVHHKQRVGQHHRHSKPYVKIYWPYIPIVAIVAIGLFLGNWQPKQQKGVLAYATQMSIDTLLTATNEQRQKNNIDSLTLSTELTAAAQAKANDMTSRNYWSHNTPDGEEPWKFITSAGYDYQKAGENLAYGFNSSQDTVIGWANSPSHRENMLDANYSEVGFGFANAKDYNQTGPETVVVAMYGQPLGAKPVATNSLYNPVTSLSPLTEEPRTLGIAKLNLLTAGKLPWATFAIGISSGLFLAIVIIKHGVALRKLVVEGEEFIIHHPWTDIIMVTIVMAGYVLSQTVGVIR